MTVRIYLAGPMSGQQDFNYPAFNQAAADLRQLGFHVENPAENAAPTCGSWVGYMRLSITQLLTCDCVAFLPYWEASNGAQVEHALAKELGIPRYMVSEVIDEATLYKNKLPLSSVRASGWSPNLLGGAA